MVPSRKAHVAQLHRTAMVAQVAVEFWFCLKHAACCLLASVCCDPQQKEKLIGLRKQPNGGSWVKFCCSSLANISNIWEMFKSCLFHVGLSIIWGWYLLQAPLVSLFVHVQVSVMRAPLEPFTHQPNHRPTGIVWAKGGWEGVRQKWRAQTLCCLQFISPWIQAANSMKSSCMCRTNVLDGHWLLGFQSVLLQCKCLRWQRKIHGWSEFLHVGSNPVGVRWSQTKGWH